MAAAGDERFCGRAIGEATGERVGDGPGAARECQAGTLRRARVLERRALSRERGPKPGEPRGMDCGMGSGIYAMRDAVD